MQAYTAEIEEYALNENIKYDVCTVQRQSVVKWLRATQKLYENQFFSNFAERA